MCTIWLIKYFHQPQSRPEFLKLPLFHGPMRQSVETNGALLRKKKKYLNAYVRGSEIY